MWKTASFVSQDGNRFCGEWNEHGAGGSVTVGVAGDISGYEGYARLTTLAHELQGCMFDEIHIDMAQCSWLDANLASPLGAILHRAKSLNNVHLESVPQGVSTILSRNGFLGEYGGRSILDGYGSTIPYRQFELDDGIDFAKYVAQYLQGKGIPKMTPGLRREFLQNIQEIFENSVTHSETKSGIFGCGQYYPNKQRLLFTVTDMGMGIKENLRRKRGISYSAQDAIVWAISGSNTTKNGPIPGGLGLKLLCGFVTQNGGYVEIVSDCGYWVLEKGQQLTRSFTFPFPGTIVSIELNTADTKSYRLASEGENTDVL